MSQSCSIHQCTRISRRLCDCYQQNLCLQHINEHNTVLISQHNPLVGEINTIGDRLKALNIQKTMEYSRQKLEVWRQDSHNKIDCFFGKIMSTTCQDVNYSSAKNKHE
ncbi:unnamed protein product [Rotaria socialis]|uniref:Uncharacterized protein n=1 Tax=Rotaria socialis TaxID=392032 RepID=A0A818F8A3_9BILA|nr:unnamed protein product [Rotaria socialis]CAF3469697.1 unnamed protein product [Rotaria socialis]CAF3568013.1 unnamed protein product [Rotaria socialis]CAF4176864.1 unnamed protein product [Rotaria socialis]